jgi:hypothetical protein
MRGGYAIMSPNLPANPVPTPQAKTTSPPSPVTTKYPNNWIRPRDPWKIPPVIREAFRLTTVVAILGLGITWLDHTRSAEADRNADLTQFRELLSEAEQLYCEQQDQDSFTYEIKRTIDRAQQLVPSIESRLLSIDYLALAAVGSEISDQALAEDYAIRAVEQCSSTITGKTFSNTDDLYAAHLTLGHIRFRLHCDNRSEKTLELAKKSFDAAIACKTGESERSKQLRGEAWLKRGFLEAHCGEENGSEACFANALTEWEGLSNAHNLQNKIALVKQKIAANIRPNVECPSQLAIAPSVALMTEDDAPETVQATPLPPGAVETATRETNESLFALTKTLLESMNTLVLELRASNNSNNRDNPQATTPEPAIPTPASSPNDNPTRSDPGPAEKSFWEQQYRASVEFNLINSTNTYQLVMVEGIQRRYRLAPGQQVTFTVNNGPLTLIRVNKRRKVNFSASIFWDTGNNRPNVPLIEITNCCFREVKPGGVPASGEVFMAL